MGSFAKKKKEVTAGSVSAVCHQSGGLFGVILLWFVYVLIMT